MTEANMRQLHLLIAVAAALFGCSLTFPSAARADSLSCTSVNGTTRCIGSDGLDCHSENGRMVCAPGAKGSCETIGGTVTCYNGGATQSFRTSPSPPRKPDNDAPFRDRAPFDPDEE
jgi:hypothetical protein